MHIKSKAAFLVGIIFILIGIIWFSVIFQRGRRFLPKEARTYSDIVRRAALGQEALKAEMQESFKMTAKVSDYMSKAYIVAFWGIGLLELLTSILYVLAGISLLRLYPFGRVLAGMTIFLDIIFKALVIAYENMVALPLSAMFQGHNIIRNYFLYEDNVATRIAGFLSGLTWSDPRYMIYAFVYFIYVLLIVYFCKHKKIVAALKK